MKQKIGGERKKRKNLSLETSLEITGNFFVFYRTINIIILPSSCILTLETKLINEYNSILLICFILDQFPEEDRIMVENLQANLHLARW